MGEQPQPSTPAPPQGSLCLASDRIIAGARPVGRMRREPPAGAGDSGWRFHAYDSAPTPNNPDDLHQYPLSAVAARDPRVVPLLPSPTGSAFVHDPDTGGLVKVDDWEPSPLG